MKVAITGHRTLGGDFDKEVLKNTLIGLIEEGYDTYYCGMALGFDTVTAELLLELKKNYQVKICACVPCADQDKKFSDAQKAKYKEILSQCDEKVVLSESYYSGCMYVRNRYMVDRADLVLAYLNTDAGGTAYTVKYARKKNIKIINIAEKE